MEKIMLEGSNLRKGNVLSTIILSESKKLKVDIQTLTSNEKLKNDSSDKLAIGNTSTI